MYYFCWSCQILWDIAHDLRLCPQCHEQGVLSFLDIPHIELLVELEPEEPREQDEEEFIELQPVNQVERPIIYYDTGPIEYTHGATPQNCYVCLSNIEGIIILSIKTTI